MSTGPQLLPLDKNSFCHCVPKSIFSRTIPFFLHHAALPKVAEQSFY